MSNTENKPKRYEDLSVEERFQRVNALWLQIEDVIKGKGSGDVDSFFIALHKLGSETDMFMRHFFNEKDPAMVIGNLDILNKVSKIQLMIKIR